MAYCSTCGLQVQDGVAFCPSCGAAIGAAPVQAPPQPYQPQQQAPQNQQQPPQYQQQQYQQQPPQYQQPIKTPAPGIGDPQDVEQNKGMAVIAYLIFFVPLIAGTIKTSPYVRFHANQGTMLAIVAVALSTILAILSTIITAILFAINPWGAFGVVSIFITLIWLAFSAGILVLLILGIMNAVQGKMKYLPLIGAFKLIK